MITLLTYLVFAAAGLVSVYAIISSWIQVQDQVFALISLHLRDTDGVAKAVHHSWMPNPTLLARPS